MGTFKKAVRRKQKLRVLLEAPAGGGKTYSALLLAKSLGKRIAVIDTEKGSASLYDKLVDFDVCELEPPYSPNNYIMAIHEAEKAGYDVLIIDSLSHEWSGKGGCLEIQQQLGGRFTDWVQVTPKHNRFIETILRSNMHIIATARTKSDWAIDLNDKGKVTPTKVGLKTEQRDGLDFEFTTVFRLNQNHIATASKDRTGLFDNYGALITEQTGQMLMEWLNDGITISQKPVSDNKVIEEKRDTTAEDFIEEFKTRCKKLLNSGQIKLFMKQNKLSVKDDSVINFMKGQDLELAIAKFLEDVDE